jgi:hypothetical protein
MLLPLTFDILITKLKVVSHFYYTTHKHLPNFLVISYFYFYVSRNYCLTRNRNNGNI